MSEEILSDPSNHSHEYESQATSNPVPSKFIFLSDPSKHSHEYESQATSNRVSSKFKKRKPKRKRMSQEIQSDPSSNHPREHESEAISNPVSPNQPSRHLLYASNRENYLKIGLPLYEASIKCDWKDAKAILDKNTNMELVRCSITENAETALHIAASANAPKKKVDEFVKNLVTLMVNKDLELVNNNQNTALYLAAAAGNLETVKIMMGKNPALDTIPGARGHWMPLYAAVLFGNKDVAEYLYKSSEELTKVGWNPENRSWLPKICVNTDMFDIAIKIVKKYPELGRDSRLLGILARKPKAFHEKKSQNTESNILRRTIKSVSEVIGYKAGTPVKESDALSLLRILWEDIVKLPKEDMERIVKGPPDLNKPEMRDTHHCPRVMFIAAEVGNTNFILELIRRQPDLIWQVDDNNQTIFHVAVKHRHEGIYNLLYEIGSMKDMVTPLKDKDRNNILHLAAMSTRKKNLEDVSGAALRMQRELLWFEEVERMIPPSYRERKNKNGFTPRELFTMEHQDLIDQGEKWMKETASQCMVVATLIATIVFAAAFTVPGGYDQNNGIPMFKQKSSFVAFVVADAISLVLSSASILTFLSILTSRYAERDFVASLPMKLMLGLVTLFLSIVAMMVTFSVSFFVLYHKEMKWIPIFISGFAVIPAILYIVLQYQLLFDVVRSAYGGKYLFKPKKQVLFYYEKPQDPQDLTHITSDPQDLTHITSDR